MKTHPQRFSLVSADPSKRSRNLLLVVAALMLTPGLTTPLVAEDSPWSVAVKVGQTNVEEDFGVSTLGWRADDDDQSVGLAIGYVFHRNFAVEVGYHDLGTYPGLPGRCDAEVCPLPAAGDLLVATYPAEAEFTGFSLTAIPRWPVTDRFVLYGKLGVFDWDSDLTPLFEFQTFESQSDTDLLAGAGARYDAANGFGVFLEYETSDLFESLSFGTGWRF